MSRSLAIGVVVYRQIRNIRNRGLTKTKTTTPLFQRYRKELGLKDGETHETSKKVVVEDLERVLSRKEIKEIKAKVRAEVLLSQ